MKLREYWTKGRTAAAAIITVVAGTGGLHLNNAHERLDQLDTALEHTKSVLTKAQERIHQLEKALDVLEENDEPQKLGAIDDDITDGAIEILDGLFGDEQEGGDDAND